MTNPVPTMADPGDYFLNLLATAKGIGGSTGSRTSGTSVSAEGISRLIQTAMQGQGGMAGILAAPAIAGGYNSSTRSLLANDLMARISAEAAAKTSRATETTKQGGVATGDIFKSLALREGSKLVSKGLQSAVAGLSTSGARVKDMAGFYDGSGFGTQAQSAFGGTTTSADWLSSSPDISGSITGYDGLTSSSSDLGLGMSSSASGFNPYAGVGTAVFNAADGEWGGNDLGSTVGSTLGSYFGPIGSAVGGWIGNAVGDAALNGTESYMANSGAGLFTGDATIEDVVNSGFGLRDIFTTDRNAVFDLGSALGDLFGW